MTRPDPTRDTDDRTTDGRRADHGTSDDPGKWPGGQTRRDFVRAAGATAGAFAVGASASGTASAAQGDGPGQDVPLPRLQTDGNLVVDPEGNTVTLRGLNVADVRRLNATAPNRGKTAVQVIDYLTDSSLGWHPRVLRLPIHPGDVGGESPIPAGYKAYYEPPTFTKDQLETYCKEHLDPAVQRCKERGVYAIVDYHRHWGPPNWDTEAIDEELRLFWDYVAARYGDMEHVLFEVYNEPFKPQLAGTLVDNEGDVHDDWVLWKEVCGGWIDVIREHSDNLVIVGSPNYSQRPEAAVISPFPQENLAYAYHIYSGHGVSKDNAWDEPDGALESVATPDGTPVYEEHPLFVTEFGFEDEAVQSLDRLNGTIGGFGEPFYDFLESSPAIHWTAWCADPLWRPAMFLRDFTDETPTDRVDSDSVPVNPYEEAVTRRCPDLPCDWRPLTAEDGEYMGGMTKQLLADEKDHNLPQVGPDDPGGEPDPDPQPTCGGQPVNGTATVDGRTVCDVDGDGLYRDLDGNGEVSHADVQEFFSVQHRPAWKQPSTFDFNDNEVVGHGDVVALFEHVATGGL